MKIFKIAFKLSVFALAVCFAEPSRANGYDDRIALQNAARQLNEFDRAQSRKAENRVVNNESDSSVLIVAVILAAIAIKILYHKFCLIPTSPLAIKARKEYLKQLAKNQNFLDDNYNFFASDGLRSISLNPTDKTILISSFHEEPYYYEVENSLINADSASELIKGSQLSEVSRPNPNQIFLRTLSLSNPEVIFDFSEVDKKLADKLYAQLLGFKRN